ncbi:MAG: ATP-binding protein [Alphaproteobacteria bacterium]
MALTIVALAAVALSLALATHYRIRCRRAEREFDGLVAQLDRHEEALGRAPVAYIAWDRTGDDEYHSAGLPLLIGLHPTTAVSWNVLRGRLAPADGAMLEDAVAALLQGGEPFATTVRTVDGERARAVSGMRADQGVRRMDVLWIADATAASAPAARFAADARALREERDRFLTLLDAMPLPVWQRARDLSLAFCNRAYAAAVDAEAPAAALVDGREIAAGLVDPSGRALAERAIRAGAPQSESHHIVVAGSRRFVEFCEFPLGDAGFVGGYAQDFTAMEGIQANLNLHIDAHAEVLEQLRSGIAMFGPDGHLRFFNRGYAALWRLDAEWLAGEPALGEILEVLRERRRLPEVADFRAYKQTRLAMFQAVLEPREEYLYLPDDTTVREIVAPHPLGGLMFLYEDVTDRLALETSYNTLTAVQRETLNELREGVAVYGTDGRIKLCNPAFLRHWRLTEGFVAAEPHIAEVVERNRPLFRFEGGWEAFKQSIVDRVMRRVTGAGRLPLTDGRVIDFNTVPLPDGSVLYSETDVTDSYNVERALVERNEALQEADRLKTEFLANVSYELRTPLNTIIGFTEILSNAYFGDLNLRQAEYTRGILEASQRLLALINDILDLAMVEAGQLTLEPERIDVPALLESVLGLARERAREQNLDIVSEATPDAGPIVADARRLRQVLFNLVSNALKFTPPGGRVALRAHRDGGDVVIEVSDTGIGIVKDDLQRVFAAFERGRSGAEPPLGEQRTAGAGLGLTLVKKFIEMHGGRIDLRSTLGEGTTVTCRLPIGGGAAEGGAAMTDPGPAPAPRPSETPSARHSLP